MIEQTKRHSNINGVIVGNETILHYQRLLDYIVPDFVHVLSGGRIVKSAARNWRWSSSRRATAGSTRRRADAEKTWHSSQRSFIPG